MLPNNLCEDLICNQLSRINVQQTEIEMKTAEEYKRFFKLWNSTRNVSDISNEYLTKSFQRCLIYVLSILKESDQLFSQMQLYKNGFMIVFFMVDKKNNFD